MLTHITGLATQLASSNLQPATSLSVTAYPVGAFVSATASASPITVRAGHSIVSGDDFLVVRGTTIVGLRTASGTVTATSVPYGGSSLSVVVGDHVINLGNDTSVTADVPNWDGSKMVIFDEPSGAATKLTDATVTSDAVSGEYNFYYKGSGALWVIVHAATAVREVVTSTGGLASTLNIADYGAAVDGSTDDSGAVNSAVLVLESIGGGAVLFPEGDCELASAINLKSTVDMVGLGKGSKISTTSQLIQLMAGSGVTDINIYHLFFEGGSTNATASNVDTGISLVSTCKRVNIHHCEFRKFANCLWADTCEFLTISHCSFFEWSWTSNFWRQIDTGIISDNIMDGRRAGVGDGVVAQYGPVVEDQSVSNSSEYVNISNNVINWIGVNSILLSGTSCIVNGNVCNENEGSAGINVITLAAEVADPTGTGNDNSVIGNILNAAGGIAIGGNSSGFGGEHNVVTGNIIRGSLFSGITLNNGSRYTVVSNNAMYQTKSHGIITGATKVKNCMISGNYVFEAGKGGIGNIRGILCQSTDGVLVKGNYVEAADTIGIYQNGTCNDWTVIDNVVIDTGRVTALTLQTAIRDAANPGTRTFISGNRTYSKDGVHQGFGVVVDSTSTGAVVSNNNNKGHLTTEGMSLATGTMSGVANNFSNRTTLPVIASAATITLTQEFDTFSITGTTAITSVTASWFGRKVTLIFAGVLTFTDGSNLKLAGDFVTTADDSITLVCDGTNWIEVSRSVN